MATITAPHHRFENIQAVIFDKDGTLANVELYLQQLGQRRVDCLAARLPTDRSALLRALGITPQGLNPAGALAVASRYENTISAATYLAASGIDWIQALDLAEAAFAEADRDFQPKATQTPLIAGVRALLTASKQAQVKLALLSADIQPQVESFAMTYGLHEDFDYLQGTSQAQPTKTHPQFFAMACQHLQVNPQQVLVIGDSAADLRMAEVGGAAGFLGFSGGWRLPKMIVGASGIISCYSQLQISAS